MLLPALAPVADYLRRVDPETAPMVERAMRIGASFAGGSAAVTASAQALLPTAEQDAPVPVPALAHPRRELSVMSAAG
ncbi:hypothetical protein [Streptomyces sp. NBC_00989]|uniref:hypothetical protein n=1 Tax=Streptomyces sp. NBC_00989 TaxID=2903705 RepID=UPI00386FE86E|nr:hypothetical protein OG714_48665 [Streptomyces sp. NBC_00989]